ncbi:hypothetical protein Scep_016065 [Stephania cephalantha]|uniref:Uncharacterized protein n=1 Tax=Stephania cephalantha TaxID=152367 RepID=A0AAP0IM58_9MAGN
METGSCTPEADDKIGEDMPSWLIRYDVDDVTWSSCRRRICESPGLPSGVLRSRFRQGRRKSSVERDTMEGGRRRAGWVNDVLLECTRATEKEDKRLWGHRSEEQRQWYVEGAAAANEGVAAAEEGAAEEGACGGRSPQQQWRNEEGNVSII